MSAPDVPPRDRLVDVNEALDAALAFASDRVLSLRSDDWKRSTPCTEWTVRDVVNHLVGELLNVPRQLAGTSAAELRAAAGADHVNKDPMAVWTAAAAAAAAALRVPGALDTIVDLGLGDFPGVELAWLLVTDVVVHTWDIAVGVGGDTEIPFDLVDATWRKLSTQRIVLELSGAYGTPRLLNGAASPQERLLALVGRT